MATTQDRYPHLVVWAAAEARRLRGPGPRPARSDDDPAGNGNVDELSRRRDPESTTQGLPASPEVPGLSRAVTSPPAGHSFSVDSSFSGDVATLVVVGELDMDTAPTFGDALALAQNRDSPGTLMIDVSGLEFIDSCGLHQLVLALERQGEVGGEVVLRSPRPNTLRVLEMVGLTQAFRVV